MLAETWGFYSIYKYQSLCCLPKLIIVLYVDYISIKELKNKKFYFFLPTFFHLVF